MKRKIWLTVLTVLVAAIGALAFAACNKGGGSNKTEGPETGAYYYDGEASEYLLTLDSGDRFTLLVRDASKSGVYTLDGESLTLRFNRSEDGEISAVYRDGVITLEYDGAQMRFLRRTVFKVSFDSKGGSPVEALQVYNGKTVQKPADPVRSGFTFMGWYSDAECTTPFQFGAAAVTEDVTLYALWREGTVGVEFTVDFDLGYEAEAPAPQQTVGGRLRALPAPERAGYTFRGWWVSMYDDAERLSYLAEEADVYSEDVTLHAVWEAEGTKLSSPGIRYTESGISWTAVPGATSYTVTAAGPSGFDPIDETAPSTSLSIDFKSAPAGDYTVSVTATTGSGSSEPAVSYYRNKALARVSRFEVLSTSTLVFNGVENAEEYLVDVVCGNEYHNHSPFNNGSSTYFNFIGCSMKEGGIEFVVTARAKGYAESKSRLYVVDRTLSEVTGLRVDEETQTAVWDRVSEATNYVVGIGYGSEYEEFDVGGRTSFDLRGYPKGTINVSVTPWTKGYNSPAPAAVTYEKKILATPGNVRVVGEELTWDEVPGATSYSLWIDGQLITAERNSYDLSKADVRWFEAQSYTLTIRANDGAGNSLVSDPIDLTYYALFGTLEYSGSVVSWRRVIGATKYEVRVNDAIAAEVTDGSNFAKIALDRAGENLITVRFFDGGDNASGSAFAELSVFAYTVEFDSRSGSKVETQYKAYGDRMELPVPTRTGYTFAGWYTAPGGASGNAAEYGDEFFTEVGDIELYAFWTSEVYDVSFVYCDERDGDDSQIRSGEVAFERPFQWMAPTVIDKTKVFHGWYSQPDGQGIRYTDGGGQSLSPWKVTEGATVYACWVDVLEFTLARDPNNVSRMVYAVKKGAGITLVDEVEIPSEYDGLPVGQISSLGFLNVRTLSRLIMPDTITSIGSDAFMGCSSLSDVEVYPAGVTPSEVVFRSDDGVLCEKVSAGWRIRFYPASRTGSFRVPDDISDIGIGVFDGAQVSEIIIPASINFIASHAFEDCPNLRTVIFESADNPDNKLEISDAAFVNCPMLRTVSLPRHLYTFGAALNGRNGVFSGCGRLAEIYVDEGNFNGFSAFDGMLTKDFVIVYCPTAKAAGSLTIPGRVSGIGPYVFYNNATLTELIVPNWVTSIGENAFSYREVRADALERVVFLGGSVSGIDMTIGDSAFYGRSSLRTVEFEEGCSVANIGVNAFSQCVGLTSLAFPSGLKSISDGAFSGDAALTSVTFGSSSAQGAGLKLGASVFGGCSGLRSITLPAHISQIDLGAFNGLPNLEGVHVAEGANRKYADENGVLYNAAKTELIFFPRGRGDVVRLPEELETIGEGVFKDNTNLLGIVIGSNVTQIGAEAFSGCVNLTSVEFTAGGAKELRFEENDDGKAYTFAGCTSLRTLNLPDRVHEIPSYFLYRDRTTVNLTNLTLPEGVERVGGFAFYGCTFGSFSLPNSLKEIGESAFAGTRASTLTIPASVTSMGASAFENVTSTRLELAAGGLLEEIPASAFAGSQISQITFGENLSLKAIGEKAFYQAPLKSLALPEGVERVGAEAFAGAQMSSVSFPESLTSLGGRAFAENAALVSVTISGNVEYGEAVFENCTMLSAIDFEDGVRHVPNNLLAGTRVTQITLPASIESVGDYAFANSGVTAVTFEGTAVKTIGAHAFENCTSLVGFSLPSGVEQIGESAFVNCTQFATELNFSASLREIGAHAFDGAASLRSITFSGSDAGAVKLGDYVFRNCSALNKLVLPGNLESVGTGAFEGCVNLASFEMSSGAGNYAAKDGVLFDGEYRELILCLPSKTGSYEVPGTVEWIDNGAFRGTHLTSITFESGSSDLSVGSKGNVTQGEESDTPSNVFADSATLQSLSLPARTKVIGAFAFANCPSLKEAAIPAGVEQIGASAFENCTSLGALTFGGSSLKTVGYRAFSGAMLTGKVILPAGTEQIGAQAFAHVTGSWEIGFPASLKTIGQEAFYESAGLQLAAFSAQSALETIGSLAFGGTAIKAFTIPGSVSRIGSGAFKSCLSLAQVSFAEGSTPLQLGDPDASGSVDSSEARTFEGDTALTSISLPARLQETGSYVFSNCTGLERVTFGAGCTLTRLNHYMFNSCSALLEVKFPENGNLAQIGEGAFNACRGLREITIPNTVSAFLAGGANSLGAFNNCISLETIVFEDNSKLTNTGHATFNGCSRLSKIDFGANSGLTFIGSNCFTGCTSLKTIDIPAKVATIDAYAFNLMRLTAVNFAPNGYLTSIGNYAFMSNTILNIVIPSTVTSIGAHAFDSVTASSISFTGENSSGVQISDSAFANMRFLTSVSLPSNASLAGGVFANCQKLTEITLPSGLTALSERMFSGCPVLERVTFGGRLTSIGARAFENCKAIREVKLSSAVTEIGAYAFSGCSALETADLGTAVLTLGERAFAECSALTSVTFGTSLTEIGAYCFYRDSSLTDIAVPAGCKIGDRAFDGVPGKE